MFSSECLVFFLSFWGIAIIVAILLVRFAPGGDGQMSLSIATPLALYGFCIAATWIDFVADNLVSLLNFIGIIMRIPATIMGLTILAWGNSMGDLSANLTMARKGLANMAMTACFAGPVFNILMGLGLGFSSSAASTGNAVKEVSLSPTVVVGFIFILLNSIVIIFTGLVLGNGRIKPYYGYIALALYTVYVSIAVGLQFTKHGENH
uniref:Sodium/calcium exchanger membrane region domain-containing protein n=1 Tax=Craspedostauros australis TaxID=1486917 RepID=A0A7R9ZRY4_9STRA|mmetsp:Transcript_7820/g.21117  ORF Transcript_7820/g.21117 Transcript_7820/m.21117 type:complete len:207 (+) Transcript_7820:208-828(+)